MVCVDDNCLDYSIQEAILCEAELQGKFDELEYKNKQLKSQVMLKAGSEHCQVEARPSEELDKAMQ